MNSRRDRSASEDIPSIINDLLKEMPDESQSILIVDDRKIHNVSKEQIEAESKFLEHKNIQSKFKEASNPFDAEFLRKLLRKTPIDPMFLNRKSNNVKSRPNVEICHRRYEEQFLREPKSSERPCTCGNDCEGLKITNVGPNDGFILREFLLPSQYKKFTQTGKLPDVTNMCLLCQRANVAKLYINIKSDKEATGALISNYRNFAGVSGEYDISQCLLPSATHHTGLWDPVVLHMRNAYTAVKIGGIKFYKQSGYIVPNVAPLPFL